MTSKKKGQSTSGASTSSSETTTSTPVREPCTPSTSRGEGDVLPKVIPTQVKVHIKLRDKGHNILIWKSAYLAANEAKGSLPAVLEAMPGTLHDAAALLLLYESVPEEWQGELAELGSAYDAYEYICRKFIGGHNLQANMDWLQEMGQGMRHDETISQYVNRMLNLKACLHRNNHHLMDGFVATQIVQGLPEAAKEPGSLSTAVASPLNKLAELLRTTAAALGFDETAPRQPRVLAITPSTSGASNPPAASAATAQQSSSASDPKGVCNYCNKKGHYWRDCRKRRRDEETQRNVVAAVQQLQGMWPQGQPPVGGHHPPVAQMAHHGADAFPAWFQPPAPPPPPPEGMLYTISHNVLDSTISKPLQHSWLVDSGASVHLVNDVALLHNPIIHAKPIPLHLATSDATGCIIASGSVCILSPQRIPFWIHHVQCVPSATTNILSVSAALRDGAVFQTDNVGAFSYVSGPNHWRAQVTAEMGLYYIHSVVAVRGTSTSKHAASATKQSKSSILSHSCAKRYLWHSRMGHPGETWMQRLAKENLVTGIDTSLSPCTDCPVHCEACIEGKTARPSFGTSTRPALEPLDRVHIDTVGPITPAAITGERLWVTVLDEASQWKAVIPVKSKDTISAAVRDLLVYWQTQRKTTVKCVRCDRGTEFINARFKEFCASQGTKLETSAPYTPQQNGVAERANRTLKERTRTILAFAAASPTLWKEALETACTLLNMGPSTGRDLTPFELFWGYKPDVSLLRTWGCLAYVHIPDVQRPVFAPKTVPGMLTGYSASSKAYRIYMGGGIWRESRDVIFVEHLRGASRIGLSVTPAQSEKFLCPVPSGTSTSKQHPEPVTVSCEDDSEAEIQDSSVETLHPRISQKDADSECSGPSGKAEPEPDPQRSTAPAEIRRTIEATLDLARGAHSDSGLQQQMMRAQETLRPTSLENSNLAADGLTRAQRHEQRTLARELLLSQEMGESRDKVGLTESDTQSPGPGEVQVDGCQSESSDFHVSDERGAATIMTANGPRELSCTGGSCPVNELHVSGETCVETPGSPHQWRGLVGEGGDSHSPEKRHSTLSETARNVCESSTGSASQYLCESREEEVNQVHRQCVVPPNYKCSLRGTCVWEKDVRDERSQTLVTQRGSQRHTSQEREGKQRGDQSLPPPACESPQEPELERMCKRVEVNRKLRQCEKPPDYGCFPGGTCVWEEDVSVQDNKLSSAKCESKRERSMRESSDTTERKASCSAASVSGRVVGSEGATNDSPKGKGEEGKHTGVRFGKIHVPSNLREAQMSPQWEYWKAAMQEEQNSLDTHEVMEYVPRPHGHKVIPVHWIFSVKMDAHGNVLRFKARLVAQGCRQIPGVDVMEVFAPTSSYGARRTLLAVAAREGYEIHQVDVKTAFLNGELEEEVYVTQPPGFENGDRNTVCRLKKALYGLKQAPRAWHKTLNDKLEVMGYVVCKSDAGVYVRCCEDGGKSYVLIYVDDLLIVSKGMSEVERVKELLKKEFTIHDLGEVKDFLGCQVMRDREKGLISLSCIPKIDALVEKFGLDLESVGPDTPMTKDFVMSQMPAPKDGSDSIGAGSVLPPGHRYCELVGSLLYIANTTRPDISQAVGVLSRYRMSPTTAHWNEAIRVLKYLKGTRDLVLILGGKETELEGYVDADYGGDQDHRFSTTGFVLTVFGGAVVWGSKKQSAVATSTVEAEFMAASAVVKEANWLRGFLEEIGVLPWIVKIHCDNQGCINHLRNPVYSKHTKHIAISCHFAREAIAKGQVDFKYIQSARNVADIFTKPLVRLVFQGHRNSLGLAKFW
jgi:hypothetical protein